MGATIDTVDSVIKLLILMMLAVGSRKGVMLAQCYVLLTAMDPEHSQISQDIESIKHRGTHPI
jgi:hypothetical protein